MDWAVLEGGVWAGDLIRASMSGSILKKTLKLVFLVRSLPQPTPVLYVLKSVLPKEVELAVLTTLCSHCLA